MSTSENTRFVEPKGESAVIAADKSTSFWQPIPANGHAECVLSSATLRAAHRFSMGTQTLPPGGRVRLHAHDTSEEVLYVVAGEGSAEVDGNVHRMAPGTTLYLGHNVPHTFVNDGQDDLKWVWFFMPGGLEDFFAAIGRPRVAGEPTPPPFARPADVDAIERRTVFAKSAKG